MFNKLKKFALVSVLSLMPLFAVAQEVTWQIPTSVPEGSPFYVNFLERFADNADALTESRVKIEPFGAGRP